MNESVAVLRAIYDELLHHGSRLTGTMSMSNGTISVLEGRATLRAVVHNDEGTHPSLAHGHVICDLDDDDSGHLDTCVVGINEDREQALASVGRSWVPLAAGPIFSHLLQRQVLGAGQFDDRNSLGLVDCHGYFGPGISRMMPDGSDLSCFEDDELPVFDFAAQMAPAGNVHLVKVTLQANGEHGWQRNIEVNGHGASHNDPVWTPAGSAPTQGIVTQTAVFQPSDPIAWNDQRQQLDSAIRGFVTAFKTVDNSDEAADAIRQQGVPDHIISRVERFAPIAIGRVLLVKLGATFSSQFIRISVDGNVEEDKLLMREPAFARATILARELSADTELVEAMKTLAQGGSEVQAIHDMLQSGSQPQDLELFPPIVPDAGTPQDVVSRAVEELRERWKSSREP